MEAVIDGNDNDDTGVPKEKVNSGKLITKMDLIGLSQLSASHI